MNIGKTGLLGEWKAEKYLKKQGFRILHRRYRTPHGEIDLIAMDQNVLVFVEVKYRPSGQMGDGIAFVDKNKIRRIRYAAQHYLLRHPYDTLRFDVVEITSAGVRHIPNAF